MFSSARDIAKILSVIIVWMIKENIIEVKAVGDVSEDIHVDQAEQLLDITMFGDQQWARF